MDNIFTMTRNFTLTRYREVKTRVTHSIVKKRVSGGKITEKKYINQSLVLTPSFIPEKVGVNQKWCSHQKQNETSHRVLNRK